MLTQDKSGKMS